MSKREKKVDKIEKIYQEIDARFKDASEDQIKAELSNGDSVLETNNSECDKLKETIEMKKHLINALQEKDGSGSSPRISNAIKEAEKEIEEAQNKLKEYESQSLKTEKIKNNIKAYSKNKDQIRQIRAIKDSIAKKIPVEIARRDESKRKMEAAEALLSEANRKLADEKITMGMDQYEYSALLEQKEQAEKDVKEQTEIYKRSSDRILELQAKIGKCDLAWKTLFTGKSWDDIQRRALNPNTKFVRHVDENTRLKPANEKIFAPDEKLKKDIAKTVDAVQAKKQVKDEKSGLPANTPKHPMWEKFKGLFRKARNKLKVWLIGEDEPEKADYSKMDDIPVDKRDQFLEGLRRHVDKEYGQEVKEAKEAQYVEMHKAKPKNNNMKEKNTKNNDEREV